MHPRDKAFIKPESIASLRKYGLTRTEYIQPWLNMLRSGVYPQGFGALYDGVGFCCLGVAVKTCKFDDDIYQPVLRGDNAMKLTGISNVENAQNAASVLAGLNDSKAFSFIEIADIIEEALEG